jgi:hypothetical protein
MQCCSLTPALATNKQQGYWEVKLIINRFEPNDRAACQRLPR